MSNNYIPKPLDTRDIILSDEIMSVAEGLAKNTHEVWSTGRLNDGWVYDTKLDLDNKTHPSLVHYEELSDSEKEYDRRTSQEAIKYLIKCGYKIVKQ